MSLEVLYLSENESNNISKIEYDNSTQSLLIVFRNDAEYLYSDIPESVFLDMKNSESKGSYLHNHIKGKYRYSRVNSPI